MLESGFWNSNLPFHVSELVSLSVDFFFHSLEMCSFTSLRPEEHCQVNLIYASADHITPSSLPFSFKGVAFLLKSWYDEFLQKRPFLV